MDKYSLIYELMKHMLHYMDEEKFKSTVDDLLDVVEEYYSQDDSWHEAVVIPMVEAVRSLLDIPDDYMGDED